MSPNDSDPLEDAASRSEANLPDSPRVREVIEVDSNSPTVATFWVEDEACSNSEPGQYALLWVPDSGEIPLSVSSVEGNRVEFTVKEVGDTTEKLHNLDPGDKVGVRGPYGNSFSPPQGPTVLVGGGCGVPPLRHYFHSHRNNHQLHVVLGAETAEELIFYDELNPVAVSTDDGTKGHEGLVTEPLADLLRDRSPEGVITAGPEKMIYAIYELCKERDIYMEASLERIMKCGIGLCGSCLLDDFRVCKDGPVADIDQLESFEEFGKWKRDFTGAREAL